MKPWIFLLIFIFMISGKVQAACTLAVNIQDAIGVSTSDYLERAEKRAQDKNCDSIFVRMNTPGGSLQSTRVIVERILASKKPYLCLITPAGGHAGSAGAIIMQACHVNGGLPATNVGAATPITGDGANVGEDLRNKIINDTVSWLDGITRLRGRNVEFSKEIITEAKALSSAEAQKKGALDILAQDESDFIRQAQGRKYTGADKVQHEVQVGELQEFETDLRYKILNFLSDPGFAYLIFMASLLLLYVEMTHPGLVAPGAVGAIGLILSLVVFEKLEVWWGGVALIFLGIAFLVAEIFLPSFGIIGVGGLVSVLVGSIFLFDAQSTGYSLPLGLIIPVVAILGAFFLGIGYLALRTLRMKARDADHDLQTRPGIILNSESNGHSGQLRIMGETWKFVSEDSLAVGDSVHVTSREGLTLTVKKIRE